MTTIYPYDEAKKQVEASNISSKVLKLSGGLRAQSAAQIRSYASRYNVSARELQSLVDKNVKYYQKDFKANNPDLSSQEVGAKQQEALDASLTRSASQMYVSDYAKANPNQKFVWLPSSAKNPRDLHQQFYGKTYTFKDPPQGILPGEDYNCQCGMEIL